MLNLFYNFYIYHFLNLDIRHKYFQMSKILIISSLKFIHVELVSIKSMYMSNYCIKSTNNGI